MQESQVAGGDGDYAPPVLLQRGAWPVLPALPVCRQEIFCHWLRAEGEGEISSLGGRYFRTICQQKRSIIIN